MSTEMMQQLGEIKGLITGIKENQEAQGAKLDKLDDRLRSVEKSGAVYGAITGGVMAVAVGLIKGALGKGGV